MRQLSVEFIKRVDAYVELHKKLEATLPPLSAKPTPAENDRACTRAGAAHRPDAPAAKQGDILTRDNPSVSAPPAARALAGPDGAAIKAAILDENPGASSRGQRPLPGRPFRSRRCRRRCSRAAETARRARIPLHRRPPDPARRARATSSSTTSTTRYRSSETFVNGHSPPPSVSARPCVLTTAWLRRRQWRPPDRSPVQAPAASARQPVALPNKEAR